MRLLQKAGVACLSGTAFGEYGDGYLRFSIANSYEKLMDAVERIREVPRSAKMKNPIRNLRTGS